MRRFLLIALVCLAVAAPTFAQTPTITSLSGRLTLTYPAGWVASNAVLTDVQRFFASEALAVAENQATLDKIASGPDIGGSHLIVTMFPTLDVYPLDPNPQNFTDVTDLLFGQNNPAVQPLEVSGYPAALLEQPNGILVMIIGLGPNVLALSAQALDDADKALLLNMMQTLHISIPQARFEVENLTQTVTTADGRVSFSSGAGWYTGSRAMGNLGTVHYTAPLPSPIQDLSFKRLENGLESLIFAINPRSYYDFAQFFPVDWQPTQADLQTVLELSLSEVGILTDGNTSPLVVAGFPAVSTNLPLGKAYAIDGGQTIYIILSLYPSPLAPLAEAIFQSLVIQPLPPELAALPPEGLDVGYRAPTFNATLLTGETISLADYKDQVVLLNFWFTTCPPCRQEMPALQAAQNAYQELRVLGINNGEQPDQIAPFLQEMGVSFPIVLDTSFHLQQHYRLSVYPTSFLIDRQGIIYAVVHEALTSERLDQLIQTGLARP